MKDLTFGCRRLSAPLGHERLPIVLVELGEPFPHVRKHGLDKNAASRPADAYAITLESKLAR